MDRRALIDERIRKLLSETDLTFKQIIEKLKGENISASFNTIRRVNRNNIFRKPRYDAKLTPHQRKELIDILKKTAKPNLSALARHFGVCHGSIWYWWDKLTKLREKHNGIIPNDEPSLEIMDHDLGESQDFQQAAGSFDLSPEEYNFISSRTAQLYGGGTGCDSRLDLESDPLDLSGEEAESRSDTSGSGSGAHLSTDRHQTQYVAQKQPQQKQQDDNKRKHRHEDTQQLEDYELALDQNSLRLIGPVIAKDTSGQFIDLPILMYTATQ